MANTIKNTIKTRKIAILAADGVDENSLKTIQASLMKAGAMTDVVSTRVGSIKTMDKQNIPVRKSFLTVASVLYDAVYVAGGVRSASILEAEPDAVHFLNEAFKHCKPIASHESALSVLQATNFASKLQQEKDNTNLGIIVQKDLVKLSKLFIKAIAQHRFWGREEFRKIPA